MKFLIKSILVHTCKEKLGIVVTGAIQILKLRLVEILFYCKEKKRNKENKRIHEHSSSDVKFTKLMTDNIF